MKFAVAHKVATYLVVLFGYFAMVAGGAIPGMFALSGLFGIAVSWWWEAPRIRHERWSWLWTVASVFALVYSVLSMVVTGDILGIGGQFLIWLTVAKMFNRRTARDWQQLYLLAFLMLVAGSVLNPDLTYGLCFFGFVITITWALTLFHLRREMEDNLLVKHAADRASERVEVRRILDSKRIVGGRFFLGTGLLSFAVFVGSAIIFLALPRVGFGFFLKSHHGLAFTGFSDGVKLGGHGVLKRDDTVVMRIEVDPQIGGRSAPEIHWRGVAFDYYRDGRWSRSKDAPRTLDIENSPRAGAEHHQIAWMAEPMTATSQLVKQEIWLEPFDTDVLFGASTPHDFELAAVIRKRSEKLLRNDELRIDHPSTIHYTVWSQLAPPSAAALRAAQGPLPKGYDVYTRLPDDQITARTYQLADRITAGLTNNYDKALAIQAWLDKNLTYTVQLAEPEGEPIDDFLFQRKKGHCEFFASAFAILARAAHIPTRQVNGFLGGEWNEYQGYVAVRAGDAHSWDEVFFPGQGWVTFDPTPASDQLGRGGDGWRAKFSRYLDTLRFQWTKWVIEYDLVAQLSLFKDIGGAVKSGASGLRDLIVDHWPIATTAAAAFVVVAVLRRRRRRDPLAPARATVRPRARSPIARHYDQVARQLTKAGMAPDPGTTPRELAVRAGARVTGIAPELRELVELYYAAEWGGRHDGAAELRAGELAGVIRRAIAALPR